MPLQATSGAASYDAFGGGVPVVPKYIEEYFSTFLYSGTGSAQTITNNIDLSTKGGLVWLKARNDTRNNWLYDTVRGKEYGLRSDLNFVENYSTNSITAFNNNGFSIGDSGNINTSGNNLVSWSWAKAPKFFDVVTYTGTGSTRTVPHNLGSVPGCIIIKNLSDTDGWLVYHRSIGATKTLSLNTTGAADNEGATYFNDTEPTSTVFTVKEGGKANASSNNYVAYVFAHNAGGFGLTGTDNVISCGSYTVDGAGEATVSLGYEPQWIMYKKSSDVSDWIIIDNMRGWAMYESVANDDALLRPNTSGAETMGGRGFPTATGFKVLSGGSGTYIYIAIRRGPMKVPTSGTSVFYPNAYSGTGTDTTITSTGFPPDLFFSKARSFDSLYLNVMVDRLRGASQFLVPTNTIAETEGTNVVLSLNMNGVTLGGSSNANSGTVTYAQWNFRRAPSFFDEVCYTGDGTAGQNFNHNLGVAPELIIVKGRNSTLSWAVQVPSLGSGNGLLLNLNNALFSNGALWNSTAPTSTQFTVGTSTLTGNSGSTYVAYLFATCAGVSKVTTFTGNGSSQTINCGFTGGARFVLIKRVDSTGNWVTFDTARGISSGNDPALYLNSTAAEVTGVDAIDPDSTGFIVNQESTFNLNVSSATYLVLAIA